jgi:hypothetical protein
MARWRQWLNFNKGFRLMSQLFDIFLAEPDGNVVWRGTAATIEEAATLVQRFWANSPGDYKIFNLLSVDKRVIRCHPLDAPL